MVYLHDILSDRRRQFILSYTDAKEEEEKKTRIQNNNKDFAENAH